MTVQQYISINEQRQAAIRQPYNPFRGTSYCEEITRMRINIQDDMLEEEYQLIPTEMQNEPLIEQLIEAGSYEQLGAFYGRGRASERRTMKVWNQYIRLRCQYDFEFWCAMAVRITPKAGGSMVPFILNRAQREYLRHLEKLRKANRPIDVILLKARQWGGSTMTQFYMAWIQLYWRQNWNSVICSDVEDQARGVLGMLDKAFAYYPEFISGIHNLQLKPYKRTNSVRLIEHRECTIAVGSAQKPDKIRSQNISMAHLTEVGLWKATLSKEPEDVVQSIFNSILSAPYTLKVLESTAKGVGNFFHRTWLAATEGKSNFTPVFIPWFMIDLYSTPIECPLEDFISSLSDYEKHLFNLGATLEAINWYRWKCIETPDAWRRCSEFPSTAIEAFQSTGHPFYSLEEINNLRLHVCPPKFTGDVAGDAPKGEDALENVRLTRESNGCLKVWLDREDLCNEPMRDRFLAVVDIGGRSDNADNSVICIFDRYAMHDGEGLPEVAAEWCGHIAHDLLAWKAAQLAHYYEDALLVVESNTLETEGSEGNHFSTLLSEIADYYPYLYRRSKADELVKGGVVRYGFHTNAQTKPMVCDFELVCLRDQLYIEHCQEAVDEHATFEYKPNGSTGAVDGCHDDRHITRAIGNYFNYKQMPLPTFRREHRRSTYIPQILNLPTI